MCEKYSEHEDDLELLCRACGVWFYGWQSCECGNVASEDMIEEERDAA